MRQPSIRSGRAIVLAIVCVAVAVGLLADDASAQVTSIPGANLVMRTPGTSGGTLNSTGFAGTYLTVPAGGATINLTAAASAGPSGAGHLNLVIADSKFGFNVAHTSATNYSTGNLTLPGGTYLVRAERDYASGANKPITINNLSVNTIAGGTAQFSNVANSGATAAQASANALAAANTYINNYRKGNLALSVQGIAPGTAVTVTLKNSAFKFGTAVPDSIQSWLAANPAAGSNAQKYQQRLLENFNSITPENAGKWSGSDTTNQLRATDRMLQFADANNLRVRQHNLVWGSQQPSRIFNDSNATDPNALFTKARSTDPTTAANAKAAIQSAIDARIAAYVGGVNTETSGTGAIVRARQYDDLDVYNESYHTGSNATTTNANYWQVLGASASQGPSVAAGIYNRTAAAVAGAGASTRLFTNEYNVLNYGPDSYGNWYAQHVESIRNAGGAVSGIGMQYYTDPGVNVGGGSVDPFRVSQTFANLAAQGLPLELTEFGSKTGADPAGALTTALTLAYGSPEMTGFTIWGMYYTGPGMFSQAQGSVLYDANFNLTAAGAAYQTLRNQWTTNLTTTINADGSITLPDGAFYGDYEVTIRGQKYQFAYDKATQRYLLVVLKGDFNNSEALDAGDLDQLFAATPGSTDFATGPADPRFDVNGDGQVTITPNAAGSDTDYWLRTIKHTEYGDADLNGAVNFTDLVTLAQHYNQSGGLGWANASFNGDGKVDFADLVTLAQHYGAGASSAGVTDTFLSDWALAQSLVPEPAAMLFLVVPALATRRRIR